MAKVAPYHTNSTEYPPEETYITITTIARTGTEFCPGIAKMVLAIGRAATNALNSANHTTFSLGK